MKCAANCGTICFNQNQEIIGEIRIYNISINTNLYILFM